MWDANEKTLLNRSKFIIDTKIDDIMIYKILTTYNNLISISFSVFSFHIFENEFLSDNYFSFFRKMKTEN